MIPEFDFWTPSQPIPLKRLLIAIPLAFIFWLIKILFLELIFGPIINVGPIQTLYYAGSIYFFSGLLTEEHDFFEDKNVYLFIKDYIQYQWTIRKKRVVFSMDQPVSGLEKKIRFKKTVL
jgi:hypothetical protein